MLEVLLWQDTVTGEIWGHLDMMFMIAVFSAIVALALRQVMG